MEMKEKKQLKKKTVLIVDDTALNRALLTDILETDYDILEAETGLEALDILSRRWAEIALVLLDVVMPDMDGFELLDKMNKNQWLQSTPVIMISADGSAGYIDRAYDLGATDYITRPFDEKTVIRRVQNTINLYAKQQVLEDLVTEQIMEKERSNFQMVEILSNIVEFRNGESGLHVRHVRAITDILLQTLRHRCPQYGLTAAKINVIANASALHDVGKISIDETILNKPGRLTPEEFEIMKTHTVIGARMLEETPSQDGSQDDSFVQIAHDICRWHHERWDGRGYPDGLQGDQIPISAQVVALADVYDALTATRVYKPAYAPEKALEMILNGECGCFNPVLLDCLQECAPRLKRELDLVLDGSMNTLEIRRLTSELLAHGELSAASQTLTLLEQERAKVDFLTERSDDILFEYEGESHRLTLAPKGAERLGLPRTVDQPADDPQLHARFAEALTDIRAKLAQATFDKPDVEGEYTFHPPAGPWRCRLRLRTLWDGEDSLHYSRVIGVLIPLS